MSTAVPIPEGRLLRARPNLRSLEGIPSLTGGLVCPGRFLRAPALVDMTEAEASWLAALDPVVVDFRIAPEIEKNPVVLPEAVAARRIELPINSGAVARLKAEFRESDLTAETAVEVMTDMYRSLARVHAPVFATFLKRVAEAGDGCVLFHCTAGKDRTGFAAALLLAGLGVGREQILSDYLATGSLWTPDERLAAGVPAVARPAIFGVDARYLDAAFDEFDRSIGSVSGFIRDALGGDRPYREWVRGSLAPSAKR